MKALARQAASRKFERESSIPVEEKRVVQVRSILASVAILGCAISASAQVPQPAPGLPVGAQYEALPDNPGTGPYPAIRETDAGLADHVIYRPSDLSRIAPRKLGVLVWGNGGCSDDGASARLYLEEIASHGYVVIAPGRVLSGPGAPPHAVASSVPRPPAPGPLPVKTTTAEVLQGLDWALAESQRKGSPYFGKINPRLTAVSGTSCGGLQAIEAAADPRIHAAVFSHTGIFADGSNPIRGITVDKSMLTKLHTPVLYILGGKTDVAWPNGSDDFQKINTVPAMLVSSDVGHGGTIRQKNGGAEAEVAVNWLEWQLRGDKRAASLFVGEKCGLCVNPSWTVERKKIG